MVAVDTTVWVDYFKGANTPEVGWIERELSRQRLAVFDLMVCEILQGLSADRQAVRKAIDCLIATSCMEQGHALLHRDRDFGVFESLLDLRVVHPEAQARYFLRRM